MGIVLKEGSSLSSKKFVSFERGLCPTMPIANNLPALGRTSLVDATICEVLPSVPLRNSLRWRSRSPPVYQPVRLGQSIAWKRDVYEREHSIAQRKVRDHIDNLHGSFKRFVKP